MRYLFIHAVDPAVDVTAEEAHEIDAVLGPWVDATTADGTNRGGSRLDDEGSAIVRVRSGEVVVTDGPYAETKEIVAGYDVIECADLDEAIEIASRHPTTTIGAIEIRPFWRE